VNVDCLPQSSYPSSPLKDRDSTLTGLHYFLYGFVQHYDNTFMDGGAGGTAHPGGDNQMTNAGHMFIYLPYCILPCWFEFSMQLIME
jgi:hypothetical protein